MNFPNVKEKLERNKKAKENKAKEKAQKIAQIMEKPTYSWTIDDVLFLHQDIAREWSADGISYRVIGRNKYNFLIRTRDDRNYNYYFSKDNKAYYKKEPASYLTNFITKEIFLFESEEIDYSSFPSEDGQPQTEKEIEAIKQKKIDICRALKVEKNKKLIREKIKDIRVSIDDRTKIDDENESNRNIVPLINAFYNAETDEMITCNDERFNTFKKEHIFTRHFSVEYNQAAKDCPQFMDVLDYLTEGNENLKRDILHAIACLFINGNKEQKFVFLLGAGGNGKSTLLDVVGAMMNKNEVDSSFYSKWEKDMLETKAGATHQERLHAARFARGVVGSEISQNAFDTEQMKALTGDDSIRTSGKGTKDETYRNGKSFLVAINNFPTMKIDSGVERRVVAIPVPAPKVDKPIVGLVDKIVATELPAIFNVLRPYIHAVAKGEAYNYSNETKEASEKALHANDDLFYWIKENCFKIQNSRIAEGIFSRLPIKAIDENIEKFLDSFNTYQRNAGKSEWKKRTFESRFYDELSRNGWKKQSARLRKEDEKCVNFCGVTLNLSKYHGFNGKFLINEQNEHNKKNILKSPIVNKGTTA